MLGPVFNAEMLRAGRRGRAHILRWIYAGWICLQMVYVYDATHVVAYGAPTQFVLKPKAAATFGQRYRDLLLGQQFLLIVLVTPAFVAGAITDEKTRGTLQNLLTAYVTPTDIVLGKLAARIVQVGVLALTPLPLLAYVGQYAGVTPEFVLALAGLTALLLAGLGGVSMLASVWLRQTRTAVIAAYAGVLAGYLVIQYGGLTSAWWNFGLLRVLEPLVNRDDPAEAFRRFGQAALAWGGLGIATTTLAIWRLRPAYWRQLEARPRRLTRKFSGRLVPMRDVVAWKECYVGRRVPMWISGPVTAGLAAMLMASLVTWTGGLTKHGAMAYLLGQAGIYAFLIATLIAGVRCSATITGERERHTWDGLMTSPLTVREIVRGKHRGALRATWPYVLTAWFGIAAVAGLLSHSDPIALEGLLLFSLGLGGLTMRFWPRALAWVSVGLVLLLAAAAGLEAIYVAAAALGFTWLGMYFFGAVGMFCSARSRSSWKSLLGTVALAYASGAVLWCVGLPIGCIGTVILSAFAGLLEKIITGSWTPGASVLPGSVWADTFTPWAITIGSGFLFWGIARSFLTTAENIVAKCDRIAPEWVRRLEYDLPRHALPRPRLRQRR